MSLIKNASPQVILLGADDKSTRTVYPSADPVPQHCPLFFIFARKGTTKKQLIGASKFTSLYGDETFDANDKYFNHATRFLQDIASTGNVCMVQRVVPDDAGVRANANIYIDVFETKVPNYLRKSTGDLITDPTTDQPKVDEKNPTIDGYKIRFIKETATDDSEFGLLRSKTGTMSEEYTYTPEIKENIQCKLSDWTPVIKVGDELPIYSIVGSQPVGEVEYEIIPGNTNIINFDNTTLKYLAKGAGKTSVTIKARDSRKDIADEDRKGEIEFHLDITVQEADLKNKPTTVLTVDGIKQVLTPDMTNMQLTISDVTATISVNDSNILKVDSVTKQITALKNGQTEVIVKVPSTADTAEVQYIFTVQSKIVPLDPVTELKTSTMYPLFEAKAKYVGEYYNNIGFAIGSLFNDNADSKIISGTKSLPYKLGLYTRTSASSSPSVFRSLYGEPTVNFTFKEKAINPNTDARFDFEYVYANNWFNETDELKALKYFDYENIYFYRDNFELVTKKFLEKEKAYVSNTPQEWDDGELAATSSWFDFTTDDQEAIMEENYLINPLAAKSTKNIRYFTLMQSDLKSSYKEGQVEVTLNADTPIFLSGGSDGTLSNEKFEELVVAKMADYLDTDSEVHDLAINVESIFYDSGFTLDTKKSLVNFISVRKDTVLMLSTHDDSLGEKDLALSDARAVGTALKTKLKLAPESEYFGTGVCRGVVVLGTMKLRDGTTANRIPLSYELAMKAAKMMGASTGLWKQGEIFDNYPGNALNYGIEPTPGFIPAGIKPTLWSDGMVWVQPYNRSSYHFPAIQTVYDNDTSVLNNYFAMMALAELSKCADRVWRRFTGTSSMGDAEFLDAVTEYANNLLKDKFGTVVTVVPEAIMTDEDKQRSYSWQLVFRLYSSSLRSVMVAYSSVYNSSDLGQ